MNRRRKYTFNQHYFDIIDTQEKAYILGFLYADGYNNEKEGCVKLGLQSSDKIVLDFFSKEIKLSDNYNYEKCKSNILRLGLNSRILSNTLTKLGCHQAKTFTLKFPTEQQVPSHLIRHFIRGYFDGDGCAYKLKRQKAIRVSFSGCRKFIDELNNILHNIIKTTLRKLSTLNNNPLSATLEYNKHSDILLLYNYLYDNSTFYLERKHNKFISYINNIPNRYKISDEVLYEQYLVHNSIIKVSKETGVSVMSVFTRLKKKYPFVLKRKKITKEIRQKILDLKQLGNTNKYISEVLGLHRDTIANQLKK